MAEQGQNGSNGKSGLAFAALGIAFLVDFLGYAFIVPILPEWQTQFSLNSTQATLLISLWAVPLATLGPLFGWLTDKFGAGLVILCSVIMLSASPLLYLAATEELIPGHGFTLLVIARLLHGMSGSAVITSGFAAAATLWPRTFGERAGQLLGIGTIGGLLGPAVGGAGFQYGESNAFLLLSGFSALSIPLVLLSYKSLTVESTHAAGQPFRIREFLGDRMLLRIGLLIVLSALLTGALEAGVPLFLSSSMGLEPLHIGMVLLGLVLIQGGGAWMWGWLVDKKGPTKFMLLGWVGVSISLMSVLLFTAGPDLALFVLAALAVFQFCVAAAQVPLLPMVDTATSKVIGRGGLGLAFGAFGTAWAVGTMLGPLVIGIAHDLFDSWTIAISLLAFFGLIGLLIVLLDPSGFHTVWSEEMQKRRAEVR
jgi:MFS family permease